MMDEKTYVLTVGEGLFFGIFSTLENAIDGAQRLRREHLFFEPYDSSEDFWYVASLWQTEMAIQIGVCKLDNVLCLPKYEDEQDGGE